MTYFTDSSIYTYSPNACKALNVGWLDGVHEFEHEPPSEGFLDLLWQFLEVGVAQTRGLYQCEICPRDPDFDERVRDVQNRSRDPADPLHSVPLGLLPWPEDIRSRSNVARRRGGERLIGNAEIRVFGEYETIYAAPTLIYHYVSEHHYKPPVEFVRAVLTGPRPPSDAYRALLQRHQIE
jgi:hypothetical protein